MNKFLPLVAEAMGQLVGGQVHIMAVTSVPCKRGNVECITYVHSRTIPLLDLTQPFRVDSETNNANKYRSNHPLYQANVVKPFTEQHVARLSTYYHLLFV
jgi:hypothetical protein